MTQLIKRLIATTPQSVERLNARVELRAGQINASEASFQRPLVCSNATLASAVAGLPRRLEADELVVAVSRFSRPSVDTVPRKPPSVNDDESDHNRAE